MKKSFIISAAALSLFALQARGEKLGELLHHFTYRRASATIWVALPLSACQPPSAPFTAIRCSQTCCSALMPTIPWITSGA